MLQGTTAAFECLNYHILLLSSLHDIIVPAGLAFYQRSELVACAKKLQKINKEEKKVKYKRCNKINVRHRKRMQT